MKQFSYLLLFVTLSLGVFAQHDTSQVTTNQYGIVVDRHPLNPEDRSGILTFESAKKDYKLWLDNRVYIDGAYFFDQNAYNPIGNGVTIRRARFAIKAILHNNWYGEIDLDFAGSQVEMKDMIVGYRFSETNGWKKNLSFRAGNFKEGFSMETVTTSRYVTFIERSLVSKFAPSRHIGLQVRKYDKYWLVYAGVHFNDLGSFEEAGISQARNKKTGMDEGVSYTGRAVLRLPLEDDMIFHLGAGYSYRTPKTSWESPNSYRHSTRTISNINRKKYLDTDDITNVESRSLANLEVVAAWHGLMFQSEYIMSGLKGTDLNGVTGINDTKADGFYAQAAWLMFGGHYQYNSGEAEFTRVKRGKDWGDLELAVRYDYINMNDFDAHIYGGGANAYTVGLNYHVNYNVKLMLNYTYADHDRYANGKDKLYIGKDSNGELTKDWAKVDATQGTPGEQFGFIQLRIEVDF
jgi:phosphate-selective porin OprO/OprP